MTAQGGTSEDRRQPRVVVVGGGYAGAVVASGLDDVAEVVLVEPKDAFVHASAALRAVVDPAWTDHVFFPYDRLLERGRVVQDWARRVSPDRVWLSATDAIEADHVVVATGTAYPFPAKFLENHTAVALSHLDRMRADLRRCERVLIVGAGPVGVELAGELTSAFEGLGVTIVEQADDILTTVDLLPEVRVSVREQLEARGVEILTGAPLGYLPLVDVGRYGDIRVETTAGDVVEAQMWFRAYGSRPLTDHLDLELQAMLHLDGHLPVDAHLRVPGHESLWVVGDLTDVRESKRASNARAHADVVVANIRSVLAGETPSAEYHPAPEVTILPLGPDGGAGQVAEPDGSLRALGPEETVRFKGADLYSDLMAELFHR